MKRYLKKECSQNDAKEKVGNSRKTKFVKKNSAVKLNTKLLHYQVRQLQLLTRNSMRYEDLFFLKLDLTLKCLRLLGFLSSSRTINPKRQNMKVEIIFYKSH